MPRTVRFVEHLVWPMILVVACAPARPRPLGGGEDGVYAVSFGTP